MSLQHCLVLTVATGAVWMDLRTRRIANEWIITAWIAGLVTRIHSGTVDASEDNMLCVTNDGRKIGLDVRLLLICLSIPINRAKVPVPLPDLSASIRQNGSFTVIQTSRFARASHYSHYQFVTYHYLHYHCQPRTYAPSLFKMLS